MITFTSGGVVTFALLIGAVVVGLVGPDFAATRFNLAWFEGSMAVSALLNHVLAFQFNGMATSEGRRWQPDGGPHHLEHFEMQHWTPVPLAIGVFVAARAAWLSVAPWAGVAIVIGSAILWTVAKVLRGRWPEFGLGVFPPAVPPGRVDRPTALRRTLLGLALLTGLALIVFLAARVVFGALDVPESARFL